MRFKDFLREAKHRQDISVEKAEELLTAHCSDMDLEKPFWRGSKKAAEECYIIQGDQGGRSSSVAGNYYTVIMDHFLPEKGFPKRSASIILANNRGEGYARQYASGTSGMYAIFPYNDVPIGVCGTDDIWHLRVELGMSHPRTLEVWADWFENAGIPDYSYEDLVQGIQDGLEEGEDAISDVFRRASDVERDLKQAFTPPELAVKLCTSKDVPEDRERELWIGGKCVAIRRDVWVEMLKKQGKTAAEPKE